MLNQTTAFITATAFAGAIALGLAGPGAVPAAAQTQGFGLEVTAGIDLLGGDDFDDLNAAAGFETIASLAWLNGWEVGAGAGIASHGLEGQDGSADLIKVFGEARYRFGAPDPELRHLHPFAAARAGYTRLTTDDVDGSPSQNGFLLGIGGGAEYWLTNEVALLAAGLLHYLSYGASDDVPLDRSGTDISLRAGLKVRF